jgi:hypothetical protein
MKAVKDIILSTLAPGEVLEGAWEKEMCHSSEFSLCMATERIKGAANSTVYISIAYPAFTFSGWYPQPIIMKKIGMAESSKKI